MARSSFHGDHAQGCTFCHLFCCFVPFFIATGRSAAQKKASREILFTPAGTDGTTGPTSATPPGRHAHKQRRSTNQKERSISKSCILDSWSKLLTTNTEQSVCRNVSKMSPSSILEGSASWAQAVTLRPILFVWELLQEEPDTPRTR